MSTSSATNPGSNRAGPSATPHVVRATSPAKSRLIVRLPDLSGPKATVRAAAVADAGLSTDLSSRETPKIGPSASMLPYLANIPVTLNSIAGLPHKALELVRQPKFWLACVVAVMVQVVLALVITPSDRDLDRDRPLTAAKPWPKTPATPAARIVVPAAPANAVDENGGPLPGATTPMGPTVPLEPTGEAASPGGEPFSAEAPGDRLAGTRTADNRNRVDEAPQFDGRAPGESDGATLGGIAPLEPTPGQNTNEQR